MTERSTPSQAQQRKPTQPHVTDAAVAAGCKPTRMKWGPHEGVGCSNCPSPPSSRPPELCCNIWCVQAL